MSKKIKDLAKLVSFHNVGNYPDAAVKKEFHRLAKLVLKEIKAKLNHEQGNVRSNMAGIAVSGEIILHTNRLYVQISEGYMGKQIMYRSCKSTQDYTGGTNCFISIEQLNDDPEKWIEVMRRTARKG